MPTPSKKKRTVIVCDLDGQEFAPTRENPGTTYVSAPTPDDPDGALILHLCHACLPGFHALPMEEQQAHARRIAGEE